MTKKEMVDLIKKYGKAIGDVEDGYAFDDMYAVRDANKRANALLREIEKNLDLILDK